MIRSIVLATLMGCATARADFIGVPDIDPSVYCKTQAYYDFCMKNESKAKASLWRWVTHHHTRADQRWLISCMIDDSDQSYAHLHECIFHVE
jgi:hypothetical protein